MNQVFERAFREAIRMKAPDSRGQVEWKVAIGNFQEPSRSLGRATYKPDIVVAGSGKRAALVLDTKWKDVLSPIEVVGEDGFEVSAGVRLKTADLFQITAYGLEYLRRHVEPSVVAGLVYPSLRDCEPLGFDFVAESGKVKVVLIPWDVSVPCRESFGRLWTRLEHLARRPSTE
jgi:5-methylcytosine-specific restriction endonuclease McrBC regulatory subunit McrC